MRKLLFSSAIVLFLLFTYINILSFSSGIGGHTRKNIPFTGEIGCNCHRPSPQGDPNVIVRLTGPLQVAKNDTALYRLTVAGGPHIMAGFDFNVSRGGIAVAEPDSTQNFGDDITHRFPKIFGGRDTVAWLVKYIAPSTIGLDTLYAACNSVNGNGIPDTLDRWNFSDNFLVLITEHIGIEEISSNVPVKAELFQNYPNPFNSETNIEFSLPARDEVTIDLFDISGKLIQNLVSKEMKAGTYRLKFNANNLSSGVYIYTIRTAHFVLSKKMILVK